VANGDQIVVADVWSNGQICLEVKF